MNHSSFVIWRSSQPADIAARVAVAGDFLPAGTLSLPAGGWPEAACGLESVFRDVDISFANLECPLDTEGLASRPLGGIGQIVSAPSSSLEYLKAVHSLAIGIANNHSYDFGPAGVERTRAALTARNFIPLGAGRTLREEPEVFVWQGPADVRVGFWAAARASRDLAARRNAGVEPATTARARFASSALKSQGATYSVALLHCGCLRTNRPDPSDVALVDAIASSGFDLVAASHSHRISGSMQITADNSIPAFCFYGLGSIASGCIASDFEREGLVVVAGFRADGALVSIEVRPVWLARSGFAEQSPARACAILDRFLDLNSEISDGSSVRRFYRDVSRTVVPLYARDLRAVFRQSGVIGLARKARRIRVRHLRRLIHGVMP